MEKISFLDEVLEKMSSILKESWSLSRDTNFMIEEAHYIGALVAKSMVNIIGLGTDIPLAITNEQSSYYQSRLKRLKEDYNNWRTR
jgi:hypothetical protein